MVVFYSVLTNLAILLETERQLFVSEGALFKDKEDLVRHIESGTISEIARSAFKDNNIMLSDKAYVKPAEAGKSWEIVDKNKKYIVKKEDNRLVIRVERLGKTAVVGYLLSLLSLSAMVSGIFFNRIMAVMRRFAIPLAILLMGIGFGVLGNASNLSMIFIAMIVIGLNFGVIQPYIFLFVQKFTPQDSRALGMAVVGSAIFLGQFLSPIVLGAVSAISGQTSIYFKFNFCAGAVGIAGLIALAMTMSPIKTAKA
jgi:hypothetical protein